MIEKLTWDSDFFGYPIGRIILSDENDLPSTDEIRDFNLIYVFSDKKLERYSDLIREVDIKTTLIKQIDKNASYPIHSSISEYKGDNDMELKKLALESGVYSRFKRDPAFVNNEYIRLYTKWIEDSISKKIADKLIVFEDMEGRIEGFVSLKLGVSYTEIGLIAVDNNSRGKGVAFNLLTATFNISQQYGLPITRIVTQYENTPALKLYLKAGFEIEKKVFIYHIWNDRK